MGIVYKMTNIENGKVYIGLTTRTYEERLREHLQVSKANKKSSKNTLICQALRKYGLEGFDHEVLFESDNIEELCKKEIYYIDLYKSFGENGYNLTRGGEGSRRCKVEDDIIVKDFLSGDSIKKISEKYGIARETASGRIKENGIEVGRFKKSIIGYDKNKKQVTPNFESMWEAADWIIENELTMANHDSIRRALRRAIHDRKTSYLDIIWLEDGQDFDEIKIVTSKVKRKQA